MNVNLTLWKIVTLAIFALCSFYVGWTTSFNNDIYLNKEAIKHMDKEHHRVNFMLIYYPFIVFLIVNVVVNSLIYRTLSDGTSLLMHLGVLHVYSYPICVILLTTVAAKKAIELISCKRKYVDCYSAFDLVLDVVFYLSIVVLVVTSAVMFETKLLISSL